jgi:hypothetical protein
MPRLGYAFSAVFALGIVGCAEPGGGLTRIDPNEPFEIDLGRGSGWHGLNTVTIDQDGKAILYRLARGMGPFGGSYLCFETGMLQLPDESVVEVLAAVKHSGVLALNREYCRSNIADGTQWIFRVRQGDGERVVYCDNSFPRPMERFAEELDAILAENGLSGVTWHRVPRDSNDHEKGLWASIRWPSKSHNRGGP